MDLSKEMAKYCVNLSYEDIPEEVRQYTKLCILDYFSSAIAGSDKEPIRIINEMMQEMGGQDHSTLFTGGQSSVINAALINGASSHIVELDDIHKASIIHAATVVIPAALAVSEWREMSGKDLITSVVIGYEVCYRIGEAVSPSHYYYWHNTATCGTFGAAIATAKLIGLNEKQIVAALGNAGTQAAGLWEFIEDGAMTKQLHPGKAAMNGTMASLLAHKGFTGAQKILEGNRGFFKSMSTDPKAHKITENLGDEFKILENSFKVHASCRHTHHAIDILMKMSDSNPIPIEKIEAVDVRTYQTAIDITDNPSPDTIYASKFSLQYCTALALSKKQAGIHDFNETSLWDEEIRELMKTVTLHSDPLITGEYPEKWGAEVTITFTDGRSIQSGTDFPKGDPENPVSTEELIEKFHSLSYQLPLETREHLTDKIMNVEQEENVADVMQILKQPV
ncbi:MmgE/PrpD family protein [Halobacillus sp. Marseille-P3879]|uniref:MmgE/PrpD family protein n=1 Tax=Halobacillus sp. Marseille-P3879 TaxID=2045014 RepID=UPI000C7DB735|nr:MmgE/PrpD family protein [Halobacillus sp. Marseille-P3879]